VWTGAVYEGDLFEYQLGSEPFVRHQPQGEDAPDKLTHVYAVGSINGVQGRIVEVWPVKKITRHRDRFNKVGQRHYSYEHFEMYGRKVALLQVLKYIPKSIELVKVIQIEHGLTTGEPVDLDIPIDTVITNADLVVDAETAVGGADYGGQDATSALGI
jgi:recombination protein RecT